MIIDLLSFLDGRKTYIVALLAAVVVGLQVAGQIDTETANRILAMLGVTGMATLRSGVKKAERAANGNGGRV